MPRALHNFFLTIPKFNSRDAVRNVLSFELSSNSYVVALEGNEDPVDEPVPEVNQAVNEHVHAYFKLEAEWQLPDLRQTISDSLSAQCGEGSPSGFDLQACKHPSRTIAYITKVRYQTLT